MSDEKQELPKEVLAVDTALASGASVLQNYLSDLLIQLTRRLPIPAANKLFTQTSTNLSRLEINVLKLLFLLC